MCVCVCVSVCGVERLGYYRLSALLAIDCLSGLQPGTTFMCSLPNTTDEGAPVVVGGLRIQGSGFRVVPNSFVL